MVENQFASIQPAVHRVHDQCVDRLSSACASMWQPSGHSKLQVFGMKGEDKYKRDARDRAPYRGRKKMCTEIVASLVEDGRLFTPAAVQQYIDVAKGKRDDVADAVLMVLVQVARADAGVMATMRPFGESAMQRFLARLERTQLNQPKRQRQRQPMHSTPKKNAQCKQLGASSEMAIIID